MIKTEDTQPRTRAGRWLAQAMPLLQAAWILVGVAVVVFLVSAFIRAGPAPTPDWLLGTFKVLPPFIVGMVAGTGIAVAIWMTLVRRNHTGGRAGTVFLVSLAIIVVSSYAESSSIWRTGIWVGLLPLCGAAFFDLALHYPEEERRLAGAPIAMPFLYLVAGLLSLLAMVAIFALSNRGVSGVLQTASIFACCLLFLASWTWQLVRFNRSASPVSRRQLSILIIGSLFAFLPAALWAIAFSIDPRNVQPTALIYAPQIVYPVLLVYVIQRYRTVDTDTLLRNGVFYGAMVLIITAGYALLVAGATVLVANLVGIDSSILQGLLVCLLVFLLDPVRNRLNSMLDRVFFKGSEAFQQDLRVLSTTLADQPGLAEVLRVTFDFLFQSLGPSRVHIYLFDRFSDQYRAAAGPNGQPTSDLQFPSSSPLVTYLADQRSPVFFYELNQLPEKIRADKGRMILLAAQAYVPIRGRDRLGGWLALGARQSGQPYGRDELKFLAAVSDQLGQAVERARLLAEMEDRVREMNLLTRVAQGINITLSLDDILELIYAQTIQVVPSDDFRILLTTPDPYHLQPIFTVMDGDRVTAKENIFVPAGELLESEVIRDQKPILTDDFAARCQKSGILAGQSRITAWMGVPLVTGSETIGALSMGVANPGSVYQQDQLRLVQAIADQAAGAIIKARLLQETERRALQLSTLNDVTRQLSSTLETAPLLKSILESAVAILNCEAGSLLMVDEHTGELVFEVIVGPVASDLAGKRIPPGTGIVGQAVETRKPVIVNDVASSPAWFSKPDQQTGFITRTLLVVPLQVKEQIIGVIEVINKVGGEPFTADDQELISAFASQAAVAIENARLYTVTDQALAERVEELSIMQRIDRELNTSLDTANAMRVMLDWGLRKTGAQAGFAGQVKEGIIHILASAGIDENLQALAEEQFPADVICGSLAESASAPQVLLLSPDSIRLARGTGERVIVPVQRELEQMGILVLEHPGNASFNEDDLNFLARLSDHAAIAFANASLVAEVQSANQAKSEFVSFVAHELKNPMTSIKGYTELIAAGAVGEVNEAQSNFLNTIRTNVERMATLVSDLADLSRIEAGRLKLEYRSFNLAEVIEEVTRSLNRLIEEKQQQVNVLLDDGLPQVWADRTRVVQVITNLVSNATKYTPQQGEVTIHATGCDNQWDAAGAPRVVHLVVRDTGIGISQEDQKKIFTKFFRSEDPKTREAPGTGLGLNITRSLVEMQGGRIWFESEFRRGTTFHITIPVAE